MRESFGMPNVHFVAALGTDIRVLIAVPNGGLVNPFAIDAYRGNGKSPHRWHGHEAEQWYVTEHDYTPDPCAIWKTPMPTIFKVEQLMDLPLTTKWIPIDEVDSEGLCGASVCAALWRRP